MSVIRAWIACVMLIMSSNITHADIQRLPGKFVWAELITYDIPVAENFYGQLFDWDFSDENGYRVAWKNKDPVGGLVFRPRPRDVTAKSRWVAYISAQDIPALKKSIIASGGRAIADSRNIKGLGELEVFADAEGALFGLIDSAVPDPEDYLAEEGEWIWIQLFSRNAEKASGFYQQVGAYERFENPQQPGSYVLAKNGYARAALSTISARHADAKPTWVPFLRVANIAETLKKVPALGGKIVVAPRKDLYDNRVAMIEAPDGSAVGIMVWESQSATGDSSP